MSEKTLKITDEAGMHARPASKLAQAASNYDNSIELTYNGKTVDMKSIMGVMSLGVPQDAEVTISIDGDDSDKVLETIIKEMIELNLTEA